METRDEKGRFGKGHSGRPKGVRNKYTDLKQSFLRVFDELNPTEDCEHLMEWARENPRDYYGICSKLFPTRTELSGPDGKPIERRDVREYSQAELLGIIDSEG
jgi:hypothetical protein